MTDFSTEFARQPTESTSKGAQHLLHSSFNNESWRDRVKHIADVDDYHPTSDSIGNKLIREAQMLTWGVGEAFGGAVANPLSKAPELATAGAFGVGIKALQKAGNGGKVIASAIGAGMLVKMGYDELTGNRWSKFGDAISATWRSKSNLDSSIEATKESVGSLALDLSVGAIAFKGMGLSESIGRSRSTQLVGSRPLEAVPLNRSSVRTPEFTEFSLMGEKCSRALGETPLPLRPIVKPPVVSELSLLGERSAKALEVRTAGSGEGLLLAKPEIVHPHPHFADELKGKLLHGKPEEFGYLSAIREVAAVENAPDFHGTTPEYESIANSVRTLSSQAGPEFSRQYGKVATLVEEHAHEVH